MADKDNLEKKLWAEVDYLRSIVNTKHLEALEVRKSITAFYKQAKELSLKKENYTKSTYVDKLHKNSRIL